MSRFWRNVAVIGTAIVVPLGFYALLTVKLLSRICYNISGFKINSVGAGSISFTITLAVKNPSNVNIKIEGYNIDVKINGVSVAKVQNDKERILESDNVSLLDIPITMSYDSFINKVKWNEILSYFLAGKTDKIFVNLEGKFLGGVAKIPVSTSIKLDYSVAEIMKMIKAPSTPCVTGKVKKEFKLIKKAN